MKDPMEETMFQIEFARAKNNLNWMEILRIALRHAPEATKEVLGRIRVLDAEIVGHTQELLDDNSEEKTRN